MLFFCLAIAACGKIKEPEYLDVNNVSLNTKNLVNTTLSADVRFYNPNRYNINLKSGSLDIFVENKLLGHTELDSTIILPKLDTFQIPVVVQVDMKNAIGNALALSMKDSVLVRLEGKIKVGRSGVFITRPVHYESREKLKLF